MKRILSWMVVGFLPILCLPSHAAPSYTTPSDTGNFLKSILTTAEHNDLTDVAYSQKIFGSALTPDSDGQKDMHPGSGLNLNGRGPGTQSTGDLDYYYTLAPIKSKLFFWRDPDPLFIAELGFENISGFKCINGQDISNVFRSDQNVGLLNTRSRTFHVSQGPNVVTEIMVDGPVEGDQTGCVRSLTISQHRMTEVVPEGGIGR